MNANDTDTRARRAFIRTLSRYNRAARLIELADKEFSQTFGILDRADVSSLRAARRSVFNPDNEP